MELQPRVKYRRIMRGRRRVKHAKDVRDFANEDLGQAWLTSQQIWAAYQSAKVHGLLPKDVRITSFEHLIRFMSNEDNRKKVKQGHIRLRVRSNKTLR